MSTLDFIGDIILAEKHLLCPPFQVIVYSSVGSEAYPSCFHYWPHNRGSFGGGSALLSILAPCLAGTLIALVATFASVYKWV